MKQNGKKGQRFLCWILCLLMALSLVPTTVLAAETLPDWQAGNASVQKVDWPVSPNTKIIHSGMAGPDPLTMVGLSYVGHFIDNTGRTVLKGRYTQDLIATTLVWKHIAFRFDPELYNQIDFARSFMMDKNGKNKASFANAVFIGQHEKVVPFQTQGSGTQKRDFYLVLKQGVTWGDVVRNGGHIVQVRIYDSDGGRLWSKHSGYYKDLDAQVNYNTYTHSFTIGNLLNERSNLVYGRSNNQNNHVDAAGIRTVYYPNEGIYRVIYQYTHNVINEGASYYKAFRQGFSKEFQQYLKSDGTDAIARVYIKDHAFNAYHDPILKLAVKAENLNSGTDGFYFVAADNQFVVPNNAYKVVRVPAGEANRYIYSGATTVNPTVVIVDYNVDTEKIAAAFADDELATAFSFDAAFLEDGKAVKYFQYTTSKTLNIPTGSTVEVKYNKTYLATNHYQHHANVMFGDNKALDLVYGESHTENVGSVTTPKGMKYIIDQGFRLPANTPITIVNLDNNLEDRSFLTLVITGPNKEVLLNTSAPAQNNKFHKTEIVQRSDVVGGGIINKTAKPLVDEIFTDSASIEGMIRRPNTWVTAAYMDKSVQRVFAYDAENANLIPDDAEENEKVAITGSVNKEVSGRTYHGYPYVFAAINYSGLQKDMPIAFFATNLSTVTSDTVIEQVQAKVMFDLNEGQVNGSGQAIEKIAPLNAQYSYDLETGQKNPAYSASGFEGDNLRLTGGVLADHNGVALTGEALAKRQFPGKESENPMSAPVKSTDTFLGWSTKRLTTKQEVESFASAANLTNVSGWEKVDAGTAVYKFVPSSPVDKARTVYAVYGSLPEIIEVTPKDPDQPFHPEDQDDTNNSHKTPDGFVRVVFHSGTGGTFGQYAAGQDKVAVAYDVKNTLTWEKVTVPSVTAKIGYAPKSGEELWAPQLPSAATTVSVGEYTAQYDQLDKVIPVGPDTIKPDGYVTVAFADGGHGTLAGVTTYYVNPEATDITIMPPTVQPHEGYRFTAWVPDVMTSYIQDTTHTAQYSQVHTPTTNADQYTPQGQDITVEKNGTPDAADAISNKDGLPPNTTYEWKDPVDTSTTGTKPGTVVVTYPDNSKDEVEVQITVTEPVAPVPADRVGTLIIAKTVSGSGGNQTKEFTFTVTLNRQDISGTYGDIVFTNGIGTFNLKHGQRKTATNLPAGVSYAVEEHSSEGYTVTKISDTGIIPDGSSITAIFDNYRGGSSGGNGGGTTRYTLSYESNGGTKYKDERYAAGTTVKLDKAPQREGYVFTGWYSDKKLTEKIKKVTINRDKIVYAGWEKEVSAHQLHIPDMLNGDDHIAYIAGYTDGTVGPNNKITRAEVAMIFYRLLKDDVRAANETSQNSFTDVTEGMWHNTAISTISRLGIVVGRSTGIYDPNAPITRGEFATICARFDHSDIEESSHFSDIEGHWARHFIQRAAALGWVSGYMDGTFRPNAHITRAEAMAMINRVLGRLPETAEDLLPGMKTWPDNADPNAWYYLTVQEATNSHSFERKPDGVHERWTGLKNG